MCKRCLVFMNYNVFALLHWISAVIWVITVCHRCLPVPRACKRGTLVSQIGVPIKQSVWNEREARFQTVGAASAATAALGFENKSWKCDLMAAWLLVGWDGKLAQAVQRSCACLSLECQGLEQPGRWKVSLSMSGGGTGGALRAPPTQTIP